MVLLALVISLCSGAIGAIGAIGAGSLSLYAENASPSLSLRLEAELGAFLVDRREGADLVLFVRETERSLGFELAAADGTVLLAREFGLGDGREAAERLVVLTVAEALRSQEPALPPITTSTIISAASKPDLGFRIAASGQLTLFDETPQLGGELAVLLRWTFLDIGIAAGIVGGAPLLSSAGATTEIEARLVGVYLLGEVQAYVIDLTGWELGPQLALGGLYLNLEGRPVAFVGEEVPESRDAWSGVGRIGFGVRTPALADAFAFSLGVGFELRTHQLTFGLPQKFEIDGTDLARQPVETELYGLYVVAGAVGNVF